ncbi:hypothetical protein FB451DRAFT_1558639 [Mycena latifolia]|nr:hypothetical protein FB451DRAFT_1558639 [Mycena latifolia]
MPTRLPSRFSPRLNNLGNYLDDSLAAIHDASRAAPVPSNKHTSNFTQTLAAIDDMNARLRDVENVAPTAAHVARVTQIEAGLNSVQATLQTLMSRVSALGGSSPPQLAAPPAAAPSAPAVESDLMDLDPETLKSVVRQFLNANGKRARDDDLDDTIRNVRPHTQAASAVVMPTQFTYTAQPALPPLGAPLPSLPSAPPSSALPRAPLPTGPPRAKVDPSREVLFGPMLFSDQPSAVKGDMIRLIEKVIPSAGRLNFRLRRAADKNHTICVFESDDIADWIVDQWTATNGKRGEFEVIIAQSMRPNF